ncbi:neuraminidase-like domain-containing protein [Paracidovorax cattleyae]|uniref:Tc toxin subunit A-related protein n=1 Tax=Paracidovorax cattleyae TaxID=80868 RepID=UPI0018AFA55A|nr:neuraminidase-like domain-containing protein [Paracidovorax cattleyae]MBF9264062.1 hypothetical protein [Paracidovorax cattleyae]
MGTTPLAGDACADLTEGPKRILGNAVRQKREGTMISAEFRSVSNFLTKHPECSIRRLDLHAERRRLEKMLEEASADCDWSDLTRYQRMVRLLDDTVPIPADVELESLSALSNAHFSSAHEIAAVPVASFIERLRQSLPGGATQARTIHQRACQIRNLSTHIALSVRALVASPHARAQPSHNAAAVIAYIEQIPSYRQMFGTLDFCNCTECQSIFGPAAYLVDLLRIVDTYLEPANTIDEAWKLQTRRPDLFTTPLDCASTQTPVPYLSLVNGILGEQIAARTGLPAYQAVLNAPYPFNLPFSLPQAQLREYLSHLSTTLAAVYAAFVVPAPANSPVTPEAAAREALRMSIEQFAIITTALSTAETILPYYGGATLADLQVVAVFLERTGLTRDQLVALLTQNLSSAEFAAGAADGFFINATGEDLPAMKLEYRTVGTDLVEHIADLSVLRLDRLNRFIRLHQHVGAQSSAVSANTHGSLDFATLQWALTTSNSTPIDSATIVSVSGLVQLSIAVSTAALDLTALWHDLKTDGRGNGAQPADPFDRVFNAPSLLDGRNPYTSPVAIPFDPARPLDWNIEGLGAVDNEIRARLSAALQLSNDDLDTMARYLLALQGLTGSTLKTDLPTLSWLYRLARTARLLKLGVQGLLRLVGLLFYPAASWRQPPRAAWNATQSEIGRLFDAAHWLKDSSFDVYQLQYVITGELSPQVSPGYRVADLGTLLDRLVAASIDTRVVVDELVFGDIGPESAEALRKSLIESGFIDALGLVLAVPRSFAELSPMLPLAEASFWQPGGMLTQAESQTAFKELVAEQLIVAPAGAARGALSASYTSATPLDFLFVADPQAPAKRDQVRNVLTARKSDIDQLVAVISAAASAQQVVAVTGLGELFNTGTERIALLTPLAGAIAALPNWCAALLTPRPANTVPTEIQRFIESIARNLRLIDLLPLDLTQTDALLRSPASFNIANLQAPSVADMRSLRAFVALEASLQDRNNELVRCYFQILPDSGCQGTPVEILARLTGWPEAQIDQLIALFWPDNVLTPPPWQTVEGLVLLQRVFSLCAGLGVDSQALLQLARLSTLPLLDGNGPIAANWATWNERAQATLGAVAGRYGDSYELVYEKIETAMLAAQRDALLGYSVWLLERDGLPVHDATDLFDYFLIDVEMGGIDRTSWGAQAIQSVQLYLQRARLQQEPGITQIPVPDIWWRWLSQYRVWEANRRIFVYPENYADPELLSNSSPIFRTFSEDLRQNEIDDSTVAAAYTRYFDQFTVATSLAQVSALRERSADLHDGRPRDTLFLVGRSLTEPYSYQLRTFIDGRRWTPWQPIDLSIASSSVAAAYAFGRLLVFWSERERTSSSAVSSGNANAQTTLRATLKYSFQNAAGEWVQPQVLYENYVIDAQPNNYPPMANTAISSLFSEERPGWQTPQVLRIGRGIPGQGRITIAKGALTVIGYETNFPHELRVGDRIWVAGQEREVTEMLSASAIVNDVWTMSADQAEFKIIPAEQARSTLPTFQGKGKVSITAGLPLASGTGTDFTAQIEVGDRISAMGETRTVLLVDVTASAQQLVVDFPWTFSSAGLVDYTITPMTAGIDRLLVLYGSALPTAERVPDPPQPTPVANPGRDPFTSALNEFNRDLYQTLVLADRIDAFVAPGTESPVAGTVTAGIAIQLTEDLIPNVGRALLLDYSFGADYSKLLNLQPYAPHLDRNNNILSIVPSYDILSDATWGNIEPKAMRYAPELEQALATAANSLPLLYNLPDRVSTFHNVVNQTGWLVYGNGTDAYLVQSQEPGLIDTTTLTFVRPYLTSGVYRNELAISTGPYTAKPMPFAELKFRFTRISTSVASRLNTTLLARGLPGLLRLETQYLPEAPFSRFYSDATHQPAPAIDSTHLPPELMDFDGAYGQYFWEVFFYAPFLIASRLNNNQRFEQAKQWYEYLFNPTQPMENGAPDPGDRFWRFRPFRPLVVQSLIDSLSNVEQIDIYNDDPFDPDSIARLRPGSYPKAIFSRYVGNLLDWGDRLFTVDTRESIGAATNIYLMVTELLGPRPRSMGDCEQQAPRSYAQIRAAYDTSGTAQGGNADTLILENTASDKNNFYNGLFLTITSGEGNGQRRTIVAYAGATRTATVDLPWDAQPVAGSGYRISSVPQFLIDTENTGIDASALPSLRELPYNMLDSYFCVPDNADLIGLWDRVEDRLYKIRHSMNINGVVRMLPLFAPPLDPNGLVRAAAADGLGASYESGMAEPPVSPYRFEFLISQAQSVTGTVMQFGQSLLLALEKRDAEALAQLQNTQTDTLLQLTRGAKVNALAEARQQLEALRVGQQSAQWRQNFYQGLLDTGLSIGERQNLDAMAAGLAVNILATATKTAASIAYTIPNVGSPFAMTYGGVQVGNALDAAASVLEIGSLISNYIAQRSLMVAGYERREQDWTLQQTIAGFDATQSMHLIDAAVLRVEMAQQELLLLDAQIAQNQTLGKLLKQKFTNLQLYEWMSRQLSGLYLQLFQIAEDLARAAQRAYEYRLGAGRSFIRGSTWDNLYKGLLAGESLQLQLAQLERAYLDDNRRRYEIVKTVSLSQLDPVQLLALRETGECVFALSELLFDQDYPGHYQRTIANVTVSIPAVLGPYQNLKATLTQLSNQVVIDSNIEAITFLATGKGAGTFPPRALRSDWRALQQVALSRGLDDSGQFSLDPSDPRFLPFEGTGAVSSWRLSLPPQTNRFYFASISDVVLQVRYTALDGGESLRRKVVAIPEMSIYHGASLLLLRQMYPQPWHVFMTDHASVAAQTIRFPLAAGTVPAHVSGAEATGFSLQLQLTAGVTVPVGSNFLQLKLTPTDSVAITFGANATALVTLSSPVDMRALLAQPLELTFDLAATPAALLQDGFLDPEKLEGIGLILDFSATIDW